MLFDYFFIGQEIHVCLIDEWELKKDFSCIEKLNYLYVNCMTKVTLET